MSNAAKDEAISSLARASRRAEARMRLSRAIDAFVTHLATGLLVTAATVLALKVHPGFPDWLARDLVIAAILQLAIGVAFAAFRKIPKLSGAMALDRHHRLQGRIANALSFSELPLDERSPFMQAAIEDACEKGISLDPRRAVALEHPKHLWVTSGLGILAIALAFLPTKQADMPAASPKARTIEPVVLSQDDLDLFRDVAKDFSQAEKSEDLRAAAAELNRLIDDIADKKLDRSDAFKHLAEIEKALSKGRPLDSKWLEEELSQRAKMLRGSELSKPAAEALEKADLSSAEKALRELGRRMREKPESFDKGALERLREALQKAAGSQKERLAALEEHRQQLQEQLLRRRSEQDGGLSENEERLLRRDERQLERLSREREELVEAGRQLERLDRELAQAAEDLLRELGLSAEALERGAEDINRMAREQMSEASREEMLERLRDLREQLRQEGQGGERKSAQVQRFLRLARGEGASGREGGSGRGAEGERGGGREGAGEGESEGEGRGEGKKEGEAFVLGEGGEKMLIVQKGSTQSPSAGGQGQGQQGQGSGHDPGASGKATDARMGTEDVQAVGLDSGQGLSRSEVIQGASGKGFRGGGYKRVYTEYRTAAEEQLRGDEIPEGASLHVRRYFDLIRPRE